MAIPAEVLEELEGKDCRWEIGEDPEKAEYCFCREHHIDRDARRGGGMCARDGEFAGGEG